MNRSLLLAVALLASACDVRHRQEPDLAEIRTSMLEHFAGPDSDRLSAAYRSALLAPGNRLDTPCLVYAHGGRNPEIKSIVLTAYWLGIGTVDSLRLSRADGTPIAKYQIRIDNEGRAEDMRILRYMGSGDVVIPEEDWKSVGGSNSARIIIIPESGRPMEIFMQKSGEVNVEPNGLEASAR